MTQDQLTETVEEAVEAEEAVLSDTDMFGGGDLNDANDNQADDPAVNATYKGRTSPGGFAYMRDLAALGWEVSKDEVDASRKTVIRGKQTRSTAAAVLHPSIPNAKAVLYAKGTLMLQNCFDIGDDSAPDPSEYGFRLHKSW